MNTSKSLNGKIYIRKSDAQRAIKGVVKRENLSLDKVSINPVENGFQVVISEKVFRTLVIHPKDRSTDFLKPIYENVPNKTVITGTYVDGEGKYHDVTLKEVEELIKTHDRVIMLGHGCPDGLFSMGLFKGARGLVISPETSELLKEKKDNIYVWCNADRYVRPLGLQGFFSGMFISEVGEAWACGIPFKDSKEMQKEVTLSNDTFAQILGKYVNEPSMVIHEKVVNEYSVLAETSKVAKYNCERLYSIVQLEDVPEDHNK
jgi:hypothetical protein